MTKAEENSRTIRIFIDQDALVRLIGGNTEAEIAIREGIVQTFARTHLKAVANSQAFQPQLEKVVSAVTEEFRKMLPMVMAERCSPLNGYKDRWELVGENPTVIKFKEILHEEGKKVLWSMVEEAVKNVRAYVKEQLEKTVAGLKIEIDASIDRHMKRGVDLMVKNEVERRLKEVAKSLAASA